MRKTWFRIALGLLLGLIFLGHATKHYRIPLLNTLDAFVYDARLRLTAKGGVDERIVILDIDERSLAEFGHWPWSRDKMADLTNRLFAEYEVAVLAFDVVFAEPDGSSGLASLEALAAGDLQGDAAFRASLRRLRARLDYDRQFADALRGRATVLGYYFNLSGKTDRVGVLPRPAMDKEALAGRDIAWQTASGYGANLPALQKSAQSAGHFNPMVDFDGGSRSVPMLVAFDGNAYESLSLAVVRTLLGQPPIVPGFAEKDAKRGPGYSGLEWLDLPTARGKLRIPVDENVAALIPYRGAQGSFRYFSAADALAGRLSAEQLRGKIVLVGTTAPGLMDLRSTPVGNAYPGVEIHANLIAGLLDGELKEKPAYALGLDAVLVLAVTLVLAGLLPLLSPLPASLLSAVVLIGVVSLNLLLWSAGFVLPLAAAISAVLVLSVLNMSWGYFVESHSKRQLTHLFGQYVPPELVDEMARDPEHYSMEGRKEALTVLFSDVRGFTSLSEGLDSKELTQLMNEYLGAMTQVIQANRGTLDKYIGDAIMAFWGAPVADPAHARHAVLAALEMQRALRELDAPFAARAWPALEVGIGINTGTMTVGDMGSPVRQSYTVMGDAVNLGARLEGITKQYGVGILVGESTKAAVEDIVFREVDRVRVKGKETPVGIYEPLGIAAEIEPEVRDQLDLWERVLRYYRQQEWDEAELHLGRLQRQSADCKLYRLYAQRIESYRAEPPRPGWDGVTAFNTK